MDFFINKQDYNLKQKNMVEMLINMKFFKVQNKFVFIEKLFSGITHFEIYGKMHQKTYCFVWVVFVLFCLAFFQTEKNFKIKNVEMLINMKFF